MYYVGEWPREIIICLLNVLKGKFGDTDELMFQDVLKTLELIFKFWALKKAIRPKSRK
jgi:hypothetical protein